MNWNFGNFAFFVKIGDPGSPISPPSTKKFFEFFDLNLLITLTQDAHLKKDCKTLVLTLSQRRVKPLATPMIHLRQLCADHSIPSLFRSRAVFYMRKHFYNPVPTN